MKQKMDKKIEKASSLEKGLLTTVTSRWRWPEVSTKPLTPSFQLKGPTELLVDHTMLTHQWRKLLL